MAEGSAPFRELVGSEHVAVVVSDPRLPDNPVVECNESFLKLTGYSREEVIGRNCRFLSGPGTEASAQETLRRAIREQRPAVVELTNYRKDGTEFLNSLMIAPLYGPTGNLEGFIGSQFEVPGEEDTFKKSRDDRARKLAAGLTERQQQVLSLLARGMRAKQIAHELGIAETTVKMHRAEMLKKLGVRTNAEAIRIAVRAQV